MSLIYGIFAVVGWSWLLIVFAYLYSKRAKMRQKGFEVITEANEKQP